jgi:hypothetical protein
MGWRSGEVNTHKASHDIAIAAQTIRKSGVHFPSPFQPPSCVSGSLASGMSSEVSSALAPAARWRVIPVYDVLIGRFVLKGNALKETDPNNLSRPLVSNVLNQGVRPILLQYLQNFLLDPLQCGSHIQSRPQNRPMRQSVVRHRRLRPD